MGQAARIAHMNERVDADYKADPFGHARRSLVFQNPGLIDLDAVTTLGVSVKDGDTPIGYFGTGLKFAIATVLRNGGTLTLWRGKVAHHFATDAGTVRGEPFEFVTMDGKRLGFTTQLGRNWEPWMAFRELASNCRDEGGRYFDSGEGWEVREDHTTIVVHGQALLNVWPDRSTILIESEPLFANEFVEVHPGGGLKEANRYASDIAANASLARANLDTALGRGKVVAQPPKQQPGHYGDQVVQSLEPGP